jgi:hypothetical protein
MTKDQLIINLIDQIGEDYGLGDTDIATELLSNLSYDQLQNATPEEDWEAEGEKCEYCGGNCPNDEDNSCDEYQAGGFDRDDHDDESPMAEEDWSDGNPINDEANGIAPLYGVNDIALLNGVAVIVEEIGDIATGAIVANDGLGNTIHTFAKNLSPDDLERYDFRCTGCLRKHKMAMYAVAQLAQNNGITHTCECGNENNLNPSDIK